MGRGVRRAPQRHVRPGALGPTESATPAGTRPDGHQTALLPPHPRRGAVRLRAQGDPRPPLPTPHRRRRGPGRAHHLHQDPGPRRLPGHARGTPRPSRPGRPRRGDRQALLGPHRPRAHRRPRHHRRAHPHAARRHRGPPADRRCAAVHPALRRPGLLRHHRARRRRAGRPGARPGPLVRRRLHRLHRELPARRSAKHPDGPYAPWPNTSAPSTRTSSWTPPP